MPWYPLQVISCCSTNWSHFRKSSRIPYRKTAWEWLESMVSLSIHTRMLWAAMGMNIIHIWIARSSAIDKQKTATNCGDAMPIPEDLQHVSDEHYIYIYVHMSQNHLVINPSSGQTCA